MLGNFSPLLNKVVAFGTPAPMISNWRRSVPHYTYDAHIDPWVVWRWCIPLYVLFRFLVAVVHGVVVIVEEFIAAKIVVIDVDGADID